MTTPIAQNSTIIGPPGTIWMVENTGDVDLQVMVVIGCNKPGILFYESWKDSEPTSTLDVMPWNSQCPPALKEDEITVVR